MAGIEAKAALPELSEAEENALVREMQALAKANYKLNKVRFTVGKG